MRRALMGSIMTAAGAFALVWLAPPAMPPAQAQTAADGAAQRGSAGAVPRLPDGHPDLSGVWWGGADVGGRGFGGPRGRPQGPRPPSFTDLYQPWAADKAKTLSDKDDPTLNCAPVAFGTLNVRLWNVGAVGQIVATPRFVTLLSETYHDFQLVPTDGRAHRDDQPPSRRGDAVGHWDGDTFVVDVANFTDDTWMFAEGRVSFHSDALHIVERYTRTDANTLEIEATVEDPKVLTRPWKVPTQTLQLAPFDQILNLDCSGFGTPELMEGAAKQAE